MSPSYLTKRGGVWTYKRRVPNEFRAYDPRGFVYQSTRIRVSEDRGAVKAGRMAEHINKDTEAFWRGLVTGRAGEAQTQYEDARRRARVLGFTYETVDALAAGPLTDILARLDALVAANATRGPGDRAALLGGHPVPKIRLSKAMATYEALVRDELRLMSPGQLKRWRARKHRAVHSLINVVGDKVITEVTRSDAIEFRTWWQDRVLAGEVAAATANKDIGHINKMFRTIELRKQLGLQPHFAQLRLGGKDEGKREAYDPEFVQKEILKDGALAGLNEEARHVVYVMAETGMSLSEITNLSAATIKLDAKIPHGQVRPVGRVLKTDQRSRDIPLVGVALAVMKARPQGFPRYRDKADSLSATINKYLDENGLKPNGETAYSLRHTFEDRLTAVECPDKIIAALMGHKFNRPLYGKGPSLEQKQYWLSRIAFNPPGTI